jgi:hypothetical protein
MDKVGGGRWRCPRTGLILAKAPQVALWRVFAKRHGLLNPPPRTGEPELGWGRFDVSGIATLYGAMNSRGAFVEALSSFTPAQIDVHELFDDIAQGQDPIAKDWENSQHMPPGSVPAQWRVDRQLAEFVVEDTGWYADVLASNTIATLRRNATGWAPSSLLSNIKKFDSSALLGPDRAITSALSHWLSQQVLDDGSKIQGITYLSKHGSDLNCWALWVDLKGSDQIEETQRLVAKRVKEESCTEIDNNNDAYLWAANLLQLAAH